MTDEELKQIQAEFQAECGPLLQWTAAKLGALVGRREVVKLAMFNEALRGLVLHATEQLRGLDKRQPAGPGAGARLLPGCKPFFLDN